MNEVYRERKMYLLLSFCLFYVAVLTVATTPCKQVPSGFCVEKDNTQYYAHPSDCRCYIRCVNQKPKSIKCPYYLHWDANLLTCNYPLKAKCQEVGQFQETTEDKAHIKAPTRDLRNELHNMPFDQRGKYAPASQPCPSSCTVPNCWCSTTQTPGGIPSNKTARIVMITMDDAVTPVNFDIYSEIFDGYKNPNGCDVKGTFFVSQDSNDYRKTIELFKKGHEIALHTYTHRTPTSFWASASYDELVSEIICLRDYFEALGIKNIKGFRSPFLQTSGNTLFSVLKDYGFLYDSSLPEPFGNVHWPYTLDYKNAPERCVIPPCPTNSFPGLWEVPLLSMKDNLAICSMYDACINYPKNEEGVYNFFKQNYERHYASSDAPFPLFGHASWMQHPLFEYRKKGFLKFLKEIYNERDVFVVSVTQAIEWMQQPTALDDIRSDSGPFSC